MHHFQYTFRSCHEKEAEVQLSMAIRNKIAKSFPIWSKGSIIITQFSKYKITTSENRRSFSMLSILVQWVRIKIALNVVKASKLVAYNIKIKIRLGGISNIFCFCSHANMAASDKGISLKKKFLKKFLLYVTN